MRSISALGFSQSTQSSAWALPCFSRTTTCSSRHFLRGVDSRASWKMAWLTLAILSVSYGSPLIIVVGMKPMQEALGTERSVLALAGALVWVGTGSGGILMGWLADRIGLRTTVTIGACM